MSPLSRVSRTGILHSATHITDVTRYFATLYLLASRADLKHPLAGDSMILDLTATKSPFRAQVSDAWAPAGRVAESALQGSVGSGHRFTPILSLAPANAREHRAPQLSGSLMPGCRTGHPRRLLGRPAQAVVGAWDVRIHDAGVLFSLLLSDKFEIWFQMRTGTASGHPVVILKDISILGAHPSKQHYAPRFFAVLLRTGYENLQNNPSLLLLRYFHTEYLNSGTQGPLVMKFRANHFTVVARTLASLDSCSAPAAAKREPCLAMASFRY